MREKIRKEGKIKERKIRRKGGGGEPEITKFPYWSKEAELDFTEKPKFCFSKNGTALGSDCLRSLRGREKKGEKKEKEKS